MADQFNRKGAGAFDRHDLVTAIKDFKRAVFFNSSNPAHHNNLAYVLYQSKDYEEAEIEFQKALSEHPDESLLRQIKINQSLLYCDNQAAFLKPARKTWNEKGIGVLKELLEKDSDNAEYHMRLGFAYFQSTNPGGGFSELDKAAQLATPEEIGRYTPDKVGGALLILKQIQQFYVKVRLFKKAELIQNKIKRLEENGT